MAPKKVLSGIKPTGTIHLGNYIGSIKPTVEICKSNSSKNFLFIADYHALTNHQCIGQINDHVLHVASSWLAAGLDPNNAYLYKQSDIPAIFELYWILCCFTAKGLANRSHAYKAAVDKNILSKKDADLNINIGLFNYPILMAADILLFNADIVPVGTDQKQHIEIARDIADQINKKLGNALNLPEFFFQKELMMPGIDGQKMSKSYNNVIPLFGSEKQLKKSIMKIVTNSLEPGQPKDHSSCTVFKIYSAFATEQQISELKQLYKEGIAWGEAKNMLFNLLLATFSPMQDRYQHYINNPKLVEEILQESKRQVMPIAQNNIDKIKSYLF